MISGTFRVWAIDAADETMFDETFTDRSQALEYYNQVQGDILVDFVRIYGANPHAAGSSVIIDTWSRR